MRYQLVSSIALASKALAAYVPSEPWTTLTPSSIISGGATDYSGTFAIAIVPITTPVSTVLAAKRDASPATAQAISQIGDGQIQATTATTVQPISQIGDGQIQATTATVQPISQIGDGQIQATTATVQPISQIGDGQIQATTATAQPISQIGDGQIQATTATTSVVSQITDGQVQATSKTASSAATSTASAGSSGTSTGKDVAAVACKVEGTLQMTLKGGELVDSKGRIGSIVANRQFQFDGPPPQAGAIYAGGWSVYNGNLAIGTTTVFYQCLSGTFYNLYDQSLGEHCKPVYLEVTGLIDC